ncbi:MAG: hypothetical protein KM312_02820 [Hydrogenibacillus schlegelii]|uniref:Uncharacterized protein n=1 Tax=Hydrogenibacillus schlegelii TaxID=1484 RepID=A0A947GGW5_HYDSH|nr:hypothetical protein [Hydrogenibacillus schlegelii]
MMGPMMGGYGGYGGWMFGFPFLFPFLGLILLALFVWLIVRLIASVESGKKHTAYHEEIENIRKELRWIKEEIEKMRQKE